MSATRGPIPKRSDQRRRRNKPAEGSVQSAMTPECPALEADESWHPMARDWFNALAVSGQSQFYVATDWQQARVLADTLSRFLTMNRPSSELFKAWLSGSAELLTTEGARRRARLELQRPKDEAGDVSELNALRDRLRSTG